MGSFSKIKVDREGGSIRSSETSCMGHRSVQLFVQMRKRFTLTPGNKTRADALGDVGGETKRWSSFAATMTSNHWS